MSESGFLEPLILLTTSHQPPTTNHRPPTTDHRRPATNHSRVVVVKRSVIFALNFITAISVMNCLIIELRGEFSTRGAVC